MENNLQIFENDNFGQLRTIDDDGKIMFFATDVANTAWLCKTTRCRFSSL